MGDRTKGLYEKFRVQRVDETDAPGDKHYHCQYFVLDLTHDPHAVPAIEAYAKSCAADYPSLAQDLMEYVGRAARTPEFHPDDRSSDVHHNTPD